MPSVAVARASLVAVLFAACDDTALVLRVTSDRELAALCLSVASVDATGDDEAFARRYDLVGAEWPQTLTVVPGDHERVQVWARAIADGVEVARAGALTSFEDGAVRTVSIDLARCPDGPGPGAPTVRGTQAGPFARVAAPVGWRGVQIVALGDSTGARFRADGDLIAAGDAPSIANPSRLAAVDVDGDCDDDLVVTGGGVVRLFRQSGDGSFIDEGDLPASGDALAFADVDRDGDFDLVIGGGSLVALLRNDGAGRFQVDGGAIPGGTVDARALALGDVSGDGHPDLFIGQSAGAPIRLLVNDSNGTGSFELAPAALPALPYDAVAAAIADLDGDEDRDLIVVGAGESARLYVNRGDGRLEDRSFVRLPPVGALDATGVATGDFDGDCHPDLLIARASAPPLLWRGTDTGAFEDTPLLGVAPAAAAVIADADGDARPDILLVGPDGVTWIAPR